MGDLALRKKVKWIVQTAHCTQSMLSGRMRRRPSGIGFLHLRQMPKSGSLTLSSTNFSFLCRCSASRSAASFTLLLLMASIRDTRPMASSGAIGLVISLYMEMVRSNLSSSFLTAALNFSLFSINLQKKTCPWITPRHSD